MEELKRRSLENVKRRLMNAKHIQHRARIQIELMIKVDAKFLQNQQKVFLRLFSSLVSLVNKEINCKVNS